jgi:hypothetical protein
VEKPHKCEHHIKVSIAQQQTAHNM